MLGAIGMLSTNFSTTLPLFVSDALHKSDREFTLLYSVFSFGAVIGALFIARRDTVRIRDIIFGALLLGLTMLLLSVAPGVGTAAVAVFFVGLASILYLTPTLSIVQVEAGREMHGRVSSFQAVLMGGTQLIGGPLSGWLADALGGRAPFLFGGIGCFLCAMWGFFATRNQREKR